MHKGYLCLVLHGHLPYVRHPEYSDFLEEDWLYEAITETYIPLILLFEGFLRERVDFRLTLSLSPTLLSMFSDNLLQERYLKHINKLIELANREVERTNKEAYEFKQLSLMYLDYFLQARGVFERYQRNLSFLPNILDALPAPQKLNPSHPRSTLSFLLSKDIWQGVFRLYQQGISYHPTQDLRNLDIALVIG